MLTEELVVVDNLAGKISLIVYADPGEPDAFARATARLAELRRRLRAPVAIPFQTGAPVTQARSEFGADAFKAAVRKIKDYIVAGDAMQVVISQRLSRPFTSSPLSLYRALRSLNPSPYMFYYDFGDFHVVGASPEILVRKEGATVTLRPIAGTRPRGATRDADEKLAQELARRPEGDRRARDAGRPRPQRRRARRGDGLGQRHRADGGRALFARDAHRVERRGHAEARAHEHRRAARVVSRRHRERRAQGARDGDHRRARARAPRRLRGAVGYLGFQDDMDTAIAIRTAVIRDGVLHVQAGAGIVHDSVPESEWQETQNKARAILRAADMVQQGLDAGD